jgi:hypothetical protein
MMKSKLVRAGETYIARVSGELVNVRTVDQFPNGDWRCISAKTKREVRKSARQLREIKR